MLGHAVDADGQCHSDDCGQSLGNRRHCQRDGCKQGLQQRLAARQAQRQDDRDDRAGNNGQAVTQQVELALQWSRPAHGLHQHARQPPCFSRHTGACDQQLGTTTGDDSVHISHVDTLGQRRVRGQFCLRPLAHRLAFAGQRGLVDLGVVSRQQPPVGRHPIPCLEEHHISRHQPGGGNFLFTTAPAYPGRR